MGHSFTSNLIHLVFSTHQRLPLIAPEREQSLYDFIVGIGVNQKTPVIAIGGVENHVHILFALHPTMSLAKVIQSFKANSSRHMRERNRGFRWQEGYGAFSVSQSARGHVIQYIATQKEHHEKHSFEDEFLSLLKRHEIEFDTRFVLG
ncbi:MAG: transposase IS200-family protein [Acidobacteriales bacterium]|nr:transposase IS200-family protein [Terriglobales bacterium]